MTPWWSYGSRIGKPGMACRILKLKSPPDESDGLLFTGEAGNGEDEHLEHTARLGPSATLLGNLTP